MIRKETPEDVEFRPITEADRPFLARLYASTRADEMALVPWPDEQKAAFLTQQFEAQHKYYHEVFTEAEFYVIERRGEAIGRLYRDDRDDEIRLIDIALVPEARGQGLGGAILRDLLDEACSRGLLVRIHVERNNPALRLYERLGFRPIEDQGVYHLMEFSPEENTK